MSPLALRSSALASLLCLAGCDRSSPTPTPVASATAARPTLAPAAASASGSAAAAASAPKPQGPRATLVGSFKGGKDLALGLHIDRDGDTLRGHLVNQRSSSASALQGKMLDEHRFKLEEVGRKKPASVIEGELDDRTITKATWHQGKGKPVALTAASTDPFNGQASYDGGLRGSIGKLSVRAQLKREAKQLTGFYRYSRSRDDLKLTGTVDPSSGKFELQETGPKGAVTGRLRGTFLGPSFVAGLWESPDGSRSMPLWLEYARPLARVQELPDKSKLVPHEVDKEVRPHCSFTAQYPELDGLSDKKAQEALNKELRASARPPEAGECEGATAEMPYEFDNSYSVTSARRSGYVGLSIGGYSFTGGAHGMSGSECVVLDLKEGKELRLRDLLAPGAQEKLSALATAKLREEHKVQDLTEAGFFESEVKVSDKPDLCLGDSNVELVFGVYEVAPYVMGTPQVSLSFAELKPLMKKDATVDALMK